MLCFGVVDLLIAGDFDIYRGSHATAIVSVANMMTLPLVAYAIAVIDRSVPRTGRHSSFMPSLEAPDGSFELPETSRATEDDSKTMEAIETIMCEKRLFRDPDLTLNRLSRRLGIPSRQISGAINRTLGRNVSQAVNEYRI